MQYPPVSLAPASEGGTGEVPATDQSGNCPGKGGIGSVFRMGIRLDSVFRKVNNLNKKSFWK